jgi:SAM-dependent methyltransferase
MSANAYSRTWFQLFLAGYAPELTEAEIAFITRQLPQPDYRAVLDLCCGSGRHALPLAARGYTVTGIDRDPAALAEARRQTTGAATFVQGDMRDLAALAPGPFDALICMWQSFGYFDDATNAAVLRQIAETLRPQGRLILDIYHRAYFAAHQEQRQFDREGRAITETRRLSGNRLTVTLDYGPDTAPDVFDWQLYAPEELRALAAHFGLAQTCACTWCDERQPATPASPRMQLVFTKA